MSRKKHRKSRSRRRRIVLFGVLHVPRKVIYAGTVIFTLILALIAMGYFASRTNLADEVVLENTLVPETESVAQRVLIDDVELSPLAEALNQHYLSVPMEGIQSVAFSGIYVTPQVKYDFELYGISAGRYRQTLKMKSSELEVGFDGSDYWEVKDGVLLQRELVGVEQLNQEILKLEAAYYAILWTYGSSQLSHLTLLDESATIDGRVCQLVENRGLLSVPVRHFLDADSGYELARETLIELDGEPRLIRIEYQYLDAPVVEGALPSVAGLKQLAGYTLSVDGTEYGRAEVKSVRYNLGMPSWFFEPTTTAMNVSPLADQLAKR